VYSANATWRTYEIPVRTSTYAFPPAWPCDRNHSCGAFGGRGPTAAAAASATGRVGSAHSGLCGALPGRCSTTGMPTRCLPRLPFLPPVILVIARQHC